MLDTYNENKTLKTSSIFFARRCLQHTAALLLLMLVVEHVEEGKLGSNQTAKEQQSEQNVAQHQSQ